MRRVYKITQVNRTFLTGLGLDQVPLPPYPHWFVRGPRGGLYVATGERERFVNELDNNWMRGTLSIIDRSEGAKYVRPGSRLAREADV